ncbi:MAG: carboxypeptidase regulatory-like domain-containing protein [Vicinamibacterales bacterium]
MAVSLYLHLPQIASAQIPTGAISGHIVDSQGRPIGGVRVIVESPSLQQSQTTTSTANGDYMLRLLPPGSYTAKFELTGFTTAKLAVTVAAMQTAAVDAALRPAGQSEQVSVSAQGLASMGTPLISTTLPASLLNQLPTARSQAAAVSLAPSVHATGPGGAVTIAGAMSFENLYLIDGVVTQDNLDRAPLSLVVEDAIEETTISTGGISAEYGRFSGGVISTISKSGGNRFSGSWRTGLTNDNWRSVSPFKEPKTDKTTPTHEYTLGGPILPSRLWFFAAGRGANQQLSRQTGYTNLPYVYENRETRGEVKLTGSVSPAQRIEFAFTGIKQREVNNAWPVSSQVMDLASLTTRDLPQTLAAVHYTGTFGSHLFLEGQYSARTFAFRHDGGLSTDIARGTPLRDQTTGAWWGAPNFCGVCTDETRDNNNLVVKGTYFLSTGAGSHAMTFGYDGFNDKREAANHQSATDYHVWATGSIIDNGTVYPVMVPGDTTWIISWPIREAAKRTNFRTHSLFLSDSWRYNRHLSVNAGLRFDKNQGKDASGNAVVRDSAISPRLGLAWDPRGTGRLAVTAGYGRYVSAVANSIANSGSGAGTPSIIAYFYQGSPINTGAAPYKSSEAALQQVFNWFNAVRPDPFVAVIAGIGTRIDKSLASPHVDELTFGVSQQVGSRAAIRVDFVNRSYADFYATRTDLSTGQVSDEFGQDSDRGVVENTNDLTRQYQGLSVQGLLSIRRARVGGNYTLSRLHGNVNGETTENGPITSGILGYPEYADRTWAFPEGDLAADQRHRARIWGTYELPWQALGRVSVGVVEQMQSGTPYGAVGSVDVSGVRNPGYALPPFTGTYFFTPRDEFRTESMFRTDLAINYNHDLSTHHRPTVFAQFQLLNLFNQFQLFNGANQDIDRTVLTAVDDPDRFAAFNPFTTKPVKGLNWDYGNKFGKAIGKGAYTLPRTFRMSVGVRF